MVSYEELYKRAEMELSEKRFKHTLGVVERAIEYAKVYSVDENVVKYAAILHDIAKEYPDEKNYEILAQYGYELDNVERGNHKLLHAKVGAIIAKHEYGLSEEIVNAISFHTTGKADMTTLEKIIYLADATEPR